ASGGTAFAAQAQPSAGTPAHGQTSAPAFRAAWNRGGSASWPGGTGGRASAETIRRIIGTFQHAGTGGGGCCGSPWPYRNATIESDFSKNAETALPSPWSPH